MQKLFLLALFMLPFTYSTCSFDVEDNERTIITGRLVDNAGNPVPNIPIKAGIEQHVLGMGESDASGNFEIASLSSNDGNFKILINNQSSEYNEQFTSILIENVAEYSERDRDFYELGELQLNEKAQLNLSIMNTSGENEILYWVLEIRRPDCVYQYDNYQLIEQNSYCYSMEPQYGNIPSSTPNFQQTFNSLLGSTASFTYTLGDGPQETVAIPLNQQNNQYVFEY